jgi:sterol desaturase/sphingolipid hydroxylase (fatty acid hydroxylase superfamily)
MDPPGTRSGRRVCSAPRGSYSGRWPRLCRDPTAQPMQQAQPQATVEANAIGYPLPVIEFLRQHLATFSSGYGAWLIAVSLPWLLLERLRPARPGQPQVRPQLGNDVVYLAINGGWYFVWMAAIGLVPWVADHARTLVEPGLSALGLPAAGLLTGRAAWVQVLVYLVVSDFVQWCVHNLLHRVPFLWQFHKVHHSIHSMDWLGNFRFHWVEQIVYKSALYLPTVLVLGGDVSALMIAWVGGTFWGHFNHANVAADIGPLRYLFNSPKMHLWHHDASADGGLHKNFGIVLSCWDWIFGTVYWPDHAPERLGYAGDEDMPTGLLKQLLFPLTRRG